MVLGLAAQAAASRPATLIYGRGADALSLDPPRTSQSEAIKVTAQIFDTLVDFDQRSITPKPALAASWSTSPDKTRWTFRLRRNVRFHDGTPLNACAVRFSISRMIDPRHPWYRNDLPYAGFFDIIETIRTPDPLTVVFNLKAAYAPFLQNLCLPAAGIVSPTAVERWGDDFQSHPVGTGPFVFDRWVENDVIVLDRNPRYWGQGPHVDRLIFKTIPGDTDRLIALKSGAIHIMDSFSFAQIDAFHKDPGIVLHSTRGINVGYVAINTARKPLDNVLVRRAVNMAVNKKRLVKLFCQDVAIPAATPLPPGEWAHNDDIEGYAYNPARARELLRQAGHPHGFSVTFLQSPLSMPYIPYPTEFARFIKANLEAVGIRTVMCRYPFKTFYEKISTGDFDLASLGWTGDNGDPDNFFFSLFHSKHTIPPTVMNYAFYTNGVLDSLLSQAQLAGHRSRRVELYRKIQAIIHDDAPWVPLAHGKVLIAARNTVKGIQLLPILPHVRLNTVRLETE